MATSVHQFLCLTDNYGVLVHDSATGATASIDAPEAGPILAALNEKGWTLTHLLITHHHADHVQGTPELKARFPALKIIGPAKEAAQIGFLDTLVGEGDTVQVGSLEAKVIETPGHTRGQVNYYFADDGLAFTGDTLFSLGCGRSFEAPYAVLWSSLVKLKALPGETKVYCGHEYTAGQRALRADHRAGQSGAQGAGRGSRATARRQAPDPADDDRRRTRRQPVPAGRPSPPSRRRSAWPGRTRRTCSPRSGAQGPVLSGQL